MSDPIEELRERVESIPAPPAAMGEYLEKVRERAYAVVDGDVETLKQKGLSQDEIFEQTVAVAAGEGLRRLDRASEVIG